jgi:hypothetical protein
MTEQNDTNKPVEQMHDAHASHGSSGGVWGVLKSFVVRVYSLVVLLVVMWTLYAAVSYMAVFVFVPGEVDEAFLDWRGRLDTASLRASQETDVTMAGRRAPLEHYHTVEPWFQPDPANNCTTSGCHLPLPHDRRKEVRAFANLHATFMTCEMCHAEGLSGTVEAKWEPLKPALADYDTPPMLKLIGYVQTTDDFTEDPPKAHDTVLPLLEAVQKTTAGNDLFSFIILQLETANPASPVWRRAIEQLQAELPGQARGEYGMKITPTKFIDRRQPSSERRKLADTYLNATSETARTNAFSKLHDGIISQPKACGSCHGGEPVRINFTELGYTERRSIQLRTSLIAQLVQNVMKGQPFYMPRFLEGDDVPR